MTQEARHGHVLTEPRRDLSGGKHVPTATLAAILEAMRRAPLLNRKPTPHHVLYAWHTNALKGIFGDEATVFNEEPECGWFKTRLVKHGPWVPARIWMYQPTDEDGSLVGDEILQCEVNGQYADPEQAWSRLCGNPIAETDFKYMTANIAWAEKHAPDEPAANPRQPVDWLKVPVPQFSKKEATP